VVGDVSGESLAFKPSPDDSESYELTISGLWAVAFEKPAVNLFKLVAADGTILLQNADIVKVSEAEASTMVTLRGKSEVPFLSDEQERERRTKLLVGYYQQHDLSKISKVPKFVDLDWRKVNNKLLKAYGVEPDPAAATTFPARVYVRYSTLEVGEGKAFYRSSADCSAWEYDESVWAHSVGKALDPYYLDRDKVDAIAKHCDPEIYPMVWKGEYDCGDAVSKVTVDHGTSYVLLQCHAGTKAHAVVSYVGGVGVNANALWNLRVVNAHNDLLCRRHIYTV
jgi:hypothetical protein